MKERELDPDALFDVVDISGTSCGTETTASGERIAGGGGYREEARSLGARAVVLALGRAAAQLSRRRSGQAVRQIGGALRPAERRRSAWTAERKGQIGVAQRERLSAGGSSRAAQRGGRTEQAAVAAWGAAARGQQFVCG
jgi:hypothetical protein